MLNKFLNFDEMVTPLIMKIIYWLCVGVSVLSGLAIIIIGVTNRYGGGWQVISGLFLIVLGPLFVRIGCELVIVQFEIHRNITELNKKTPGANQNM